MVSQLILAHRTLAVPSNIFQPSLATLPTKRAQEALRRSEQMFRAITENASELIARRT